MPTKTKSKSVPNRTRRKSTPKTERPNGRPPIQIDGNKVQKLAGILCTTEEIAHVMGCSKDTLERRFADRLEVGRSTGKQSLRRAQFKLALDTKARGAATMLVWLGKQVLGQTDKLPDFSKLSDDELRAIVTGTAPRSGGTREEAAREEGAGDSSKAVN